MILDKAADLEGFAKQALESADQSNMSAALASIEERVTRVVAVLQSVGVAQTSFLHELPDDRKESVLEALGVLRGALLGLSEASDAELVALASSSGEERGKLAAIARSAFALRQALIDAQGLLLRSWSAAVWPGGDDTRLDIIAHFPHGEMPRRAQTLVKRLLDAASRDEALSPQALVDFHTETTLVGPALEGLRSETIPDDVLLFWTAAAEIEGTDMSDLTTDVLTWLQRHGALTSFNVRRLS